MENKIVVGNIKMNMRFSEIPNYINCFKNINSKNIIICPSYIYIPYFLNYNFNVGSQNVCSLEDKGYTGEVSAKQLSSIGVKYSIVGHSERRIKLNESSIEINKKIKCCIDSNIKVILCIGETKEQFNMLKKDIVLKRQIKDALYDIEDISNIMIAYEPIWAIGTKEIPNLNELENTVNYIKTTIYNMYKKDIKVLYGGSVNEDNIDELNTINNLDGYLIGSASVNPNRFLGLINRISKIL
ncbi:MAG: triose-phosphate isomerase family protein [bacterium]|nr:triose-phosphate isomerase family protein [bacterium]